MRSNRTKSILVALLAAVVVLGLLAWVFRGELVERASPAVEYTVVSPEAALSAEVKMQRVRMRGDTVALSDVEVASFMRYQLADRFGGLLHDASANISGDTLMIGGRLPTDRLSDLRELDRVRMFLPDTAQVDIAGRIVTQLPGQAVVEIERVMVAGIPIPERYYPAVLARIGRRDEPGLPPNALALPLPEGVGSARIEDGSLILTP